MSKPTTDSDTASTWGRRLGFGARPLLLVIDVTRAFTEEHRPLATGSSELIAQINRITGAARTADIPIIFTVVAYDDPDFSDAGLWAKKIGTHPDLLAGSDGVELDPRLSRENKEAVLVKKYASCFFGTDLSSRLNASARDTLIIVGMTTSGCVRATAVDAIQSGFRPIIARDAVGDRWKDAHDQALYDLNAKYADVIETEEILDYFGRIDAQAS
ncbi:isochorismatase family protein [Amorphus sp. 3PC139-8]|uniref:isochorismatase family protein n=1 Tax=Amorphus sp. 3PC139-8 TaxID=2735676 RepID=UPI00345C8ECD